ncbi:MAG: GAF domain-containing protein, partial [Planctomycetia bacterium]|nr:GAF domain-containing protein [Planctomycetia bacterium]
MTDRKQILVVSNEEKEMRDLIANDQEKPSLVLSDSLPMYSATGSNTNYGGVLISPQCLQEAMDRNRLLDRDQLLDVLSAAVVITDMSQRILWSNQSFRSFTETVSPEGMSFYDTLPDSILEGPDFCPFRTVRKEEKRTTTNVLAKGHYFEMQISPIRSHETGKVVHCVVEMRDTTEITRIDQTLRKLQSVGRQLVDLSPEELRHMSPSGRIELLKSRIEKNMRTILNYDIVEFRLLDKATNRLEPLLAFGLPPEAIQRELYASSDGNGITGYVAHNKVCYVCEDTLEHDMYLQGAPNVRSSLTVPLVYHDEVIGTCNVESCRPAAFTQRDMYFLQLFTRDVAVALHTFDLLSYESEKAVSDSVQAILSEVSLPIDQIVQDAAVLMNEYIGDAPEAKKRL